MTETLIARPRTTRAQQWHRVCRVDDLETGWGEAAMVDGAQVALFRLADAGVYAVSHRDPATGSHVMARGITGSKTVAAGERVTVASPLHKQVYDIVTGECLTHPALHLQTFPVQVVDGFVEVALDLAVETEVRAAA